ncbi:hypothetical protein [Streptomyces violascens]|uniref:Uncharacterized protein n=1 Tax=Streptomyces violascens TaxID=67381 RepID=A0ABQ3QNJ6_9ACTN|nr:hypothetical protein [Streptomyces violascens]GGU26014.1 hypothetical protein GCM10010289_54370 [Streptomyces violascens]GHI38854.1 hypothetical protein Sviol_32620 [Streptomyces violascens]
MRIRTITFCAAMAAAALTVLPASPAVAESEPHGSVRVSPGTIAPGGEVDLRVGVCSGREAIGTSEAFVSEVRFHPASDGGLFARGRIRMDAQDRDYDIWVHCNDSSGRASGRLTVVRGDRDRDRDRDRDHDRDHSHATPFRPVHAGGGGAATQVAAEAKEQGPGTRHAVIGLALAAVAAVAVASRSVRRRRGGGD